MDVDEEDDDSAINGEYTMYTTIHTMMSLSQWGWQEVQSATYYNLITLKKSGITLVLYFGM